MVAEQRIQKSSAPLLDWIRARLTFIFVLPALLFMIGVLLFPLWLMVEQSITDKQGHLTFAGYRQLVVSPLFSTVLKTTFEINLLATALTLLLAYPVAYHLAIQPMRRRMFLFGLVLLPFWTSILVKSFAFLILFGESGIIAKALRALVGPEFVPRMMFNRVGVMIGLVHYFIPFMVFPILSSLMQQDPALAKAAQVMGASPTRIFWRITLPLSLPGVMAGCLLTFILGLGFFITPALLGGRTDVMLANLVDFYTRQTFNWTNAAAVSVCLLLLSGVFMALLAQVPGGKAVLQKGA
jgi:putative spermidine/putrescine transport system permease protein